MELSEKQLKVFNRLHKKYPVSLSFLDYNIERILKFIKYSCNLHFVYRSKLIQKKFRVFIRYNVPKKNINRSKYDDNQRKQNKKFRNKIKKLQSLPWSQRVVFYCKKQMLLQKIKDKENGYEMKDLKTQRSVFNLDENSLSNSQAAIDLDSNSMISEQTQSNSQHEITEKGRKSAVQSIEEMDFEKFEDVLEKNLTAKDSKTTENEVELSEETADTISNADSEQPTSEIGENILSPEQIEQQIKAQLELLKRGKRSLSLLSEKKSTGETKKTDKTLNEKTESSFKLTALLSNKRLSNENCKLDEETEGLSEDNVSEVATNIVILKVSEIDNRLSDELNESIEIFDNNKATCSNKLIECSIIDSFEISEKDALEAGPSFKDPPIFKKMNKDFENKNSSIENTSATSVDIGEKSFAQSAGTLANKLYGNVTESQKKTPSIVDSLISKLGNKICKDENENKSKRSNEKTISIKTVEQINNSANDSLTEKKKSHLKVHDEGSSSSDDFFGFNPDEIIPPEIPGMLPTPAVFSFSNISAFISKDDKSSDVQSTTRHFRYKNLPKPFEDGLVRLGRPPPKFEMAALPDEISKPRTLAEKRLIFSKQRSFKYFMIENENTIYHELKRRTRDGRINTSFVKTVQSSRVPASRDLWKATCWLLTENEKFYFQTAEIDGLKCKILSGLGNFSIKNLPPQYSSPKMKKELKRLDVKECSVNCPDRKAWQSIRIRFRNPTMKMHISQLKKLKMLKENRPGPLSFKKKLLKNLESGFNQLEIYKMPKIELEVYPKLNQPLDDYIKSYLKLILPSESITKEWAEFAVSTLVEKANLDNSETVNCQKDKGKILEAKNSFKFTIPYLNDQTHILVRRVLTRSENFDNKEKFKFLDILENSDDNIAIECADVLSDMIDSVAIGLSENSFICIDPDIDYKKSNYKPPGNSTFVDQQQDEESKISETEKKDNKRESNTKSKLMKELKRLNATIITASDTKIVKTDICEKEYCRLGCVCSSLGSNYVPKKHCKKVSCMLDKCNCSLTLIEAGNSIITSEDALILRQKATAKLAKMEREFTSTVVLTGNKTLLINENQSKRKRRNNARLTNYYIKGLEDDEPKTNSRSKNTTPTILTSSSPSSFLSHDEESKDMHSPVKEAKLPSDIDNTCYVDEHVMKSLDHCSVDLYRLENIDDKVIWCMVHCLYKCFCNGKDTEGKPYILKKLEEEKIGEIYTRKAKYSFDKSEDESSILEPPKKQAKTEHKLHKNKTINQKESHNKEHKVKLEVKINNEQRDISEIATPEQKHKENRIISAYINNDFYGCHRVQPVPKVYKLRNRRPEIKNHWRKYIENDQTKFILNEKIRLSENYVRKVIVKRSSGSLQNSSSDVNNIDNRTNPTTSSSTSNKGTENLSVSTLNTEPNSTQKQASLLKPEVRAQLKLSSPSINLRQQEKTESAVEQQPLAFDLLNLNSDSSSLKISSVVSLNERQNTVSSTERIENQCISNIPNNSEILSGESIGNNTNLLAPSLQCAASLNSDQYTAAAEKVQKEVMKRLNYSVTKTMHNITKIHSEDNANIPNPQPDTMVAVRWKHFLEYCTKDKLNIWEVKIDKATYFLGTMKYVMPYVTNAISVVNIKAIRKENLPLFAQMLNAKFSNAETCSLSILMSGHRDYWRILGMTKSTSEGAKSGVIRPTSASHPSLTPKINKLFNILTHQYIDNLKRKSAQTSHSAPPSIVSLQNQNIQLNQLQKPIMKANQITTPSAMVIINNKNWANTTQKQIESVLSNEAYNNKNNFHKLVGLKMNIKIRKLTKEEAMSEHFQVPITYTTGDHRWLVLDLEDDFTHILFGNSMECLTHAKIKLALQRSQTEKKMVRFPKVDGHLVDCYIMKFDKQRIYLGPFHETIDPAVFLYQSIENKMMLREDYEALLGITSPKHTTGFWLCRKNGKIMFDMEPWISDLHTTSLQLPHPQQRNYKNIDQLLKQQKTILTPVQKLNFNENRNSLIKLIPENISLIQSQCDNLSVSGIPSSSSNDSNLNFTSISTSNSNANSVQQVIKQIGKIYKKPCLIGSIMQNSCDKNDMSTVTNILENPVFLSSFGSNEESSKKKMVLAKPQNDSTIFSPNVLSSIQTKPGELIIDTQKNFNIKDVKATKTTLDSIKEVVKITASAGVPQQALPMSRPNVCGVQPPKSLLPKNVAPSLHKLTTPSIKPLHKLQNSTTAMSTVKSAAESPVLAPKRIITPSSVLPLNMNYLKSKEFLKTLDSSRVIGKYNQVIISKTSEPHLVQSLSEDTSIVSPTLQDQISEKGPVTAEVEEQNGQLILKLPANLQNKMLSQQFTVSKSENGTLILEPSNKTSLTPKSMSNLQNNTSVQEQPQTIIKKIQSKAVVNCAVSLTSTTTTITTSNSSSSKLTIPVIALPASSDVSTKVTTCAAISKVAGKNEIKILSSSVNDIVSVKKNPNILTVKNKEKTMETQYNSKTIITKIVKPNEIQMPPMTIKNVYTCSEKATTDSSLNTSLFSLKSRESNSTPKIRILESKSSNSTKTSNIENKKSEEQSTQNMLPVVNNDKTETNTTKSDVELIPHSDISTEKVATDNETSKKLFPNTSSHLTKPSNFGIYYPGKPVPQIPPTPPKTNFIAPSTEIEQKSLSQAVPVSVKVYSDVKITKTLPPTQEAIAQPFFSKVKDGRKLNASEKLSTIFNNSNSTKDMVSIPQKSVKITLTPKKQSTAVRKKVFLPNIINTGDQLHKGFMSGYFVSQNKNYPKFGGYKRGNEYLIKTNSKTALQLPTIGVVTKHLNGFVKKQCPTYRGDVKWEFVAFKNNLNSTVNMLKTKRITVNFAKNPEASKKNNSLLKEEQNESITDPLKIPDVRDVIVIDDDEDQEKTKDN